jgi:hypothetical protein
VGSFRFRRSFKLAPGVRLSIGKRSLGVSAGVPGVRATRQHARPVDVCGRAGDRGELPTHVLAETAPTW